MIEPEPVSVVAPPLAGPHLSRQRWCDVGFLHWSTGPDAVAHLFPPGVRPDVLDGRTWIGLVPFRMVGVGFARGPGVPWAGTFLETNVRLYSVDDAGRRGVVFLSLDADRLAAVGAARAAFGLPYRWARMRHRVAAGEHRYAARVRWRGIDAESRIGLRPGAPAAVGELERFLTARWGFHASHLGRTRYARNTHPPWPLRTATVTELDDGLVASVGLGHLVSGPPEHVLFSDGVDVSFGFPQLVRVSSKE